MTARWVPTWWAWPTGAGTILATSTSDVDVVVDPPDPSEATARWIIDDIEAVLRYRGSLSPSEPDTTCAYYVYAEDGVLDARGQRDGLRRITIGGASDLAGSPDGVEVTFDVLLRAMVAALRATLPPGGQPM
jgi:hypothetical protein